MTGDAHKEGSGHGLGDFLLTTNLGRLIFVALFLIAALLVATIFGLLPALY